MTRMLKDLTIFLSIFVVALAMKYGYFHIFKTTQVAINSSGISQAFSNITNHKKAKRVSPSKQFDRYKIKREISRVERTSVNMYPNPSTNGIVNFSGNTVSDNGFEINDLSGRMVLKGNLQNSQLKHDLKTGIYFVNLENQDNAFKLIVE